MQTRNSLGLLSWNCGKAFRVSVNKRVLNKEEIRMACFSVHPTNALGSNYFYALFTYLFC